MSKNSYLLVLGLAFLNSRQLVANSNDEYFDMSIQDLLKVKVDVVSDFLETPSEAAASLFHIESDQWESLGAFKNSDIFEMSPSLLILPTTGESVAIRGYANTLSRRGIGTLIDGVSVNEMAFGSSQQSAEHISLGVADSLDIIRGPASVQYGTDAFHGVLSFQTYTQNKKENKIYSQLANDGANRISLKYSQPYGDGHFINIALDRSSLLNDDQEHWVYGENGISGDERRLDREENRSVGSALIKIHNGEKADLTYNLMHLYNENDSTGLPGGAQKTGYSDADVVGNISYNRLTKLVVNKRIGQFNYGFVLHNQNMNRVIPFQFNLSPPPLVGETLTKFSNQGSELYGKYLSPQKDFRLSLSLSVSKQVINEAVSQFSTLDGIVFPKSVAKYDGFERNVESFVLQGRKTIEPLDLDIEFGGRIDWHSNIGRQLTPRLGLIKHFSDKQVLKLIYGESFRAPTAAELEGSSIVRGSTSLNSEILKTVELIYSREYSTGQVQVTLFKSLWEEGITLMDIDDVEYSREYQNIADNSGHGVELSVLWGTYDWQLSSDLSFIESKDDLNKIDYSAFPKYIWNSKVSYGLSVQSSFFLAQRVLHDMTAGHDSSADTDLNTYVRHDVGYEYNHSDDLKFNAVVKNAGNQENWLPNIDNGPKGIRGRPISFFAGLSYKML